MAGRILIDTVFVETPNATASSNWWMARLPVTDDSRPLPTSRTGRPVQQPAR